MSLLIIDPVSGMAGDMFCAALMDIGVEQETMLGIMRQVAQRIGKAKIRCQSESRNDIKGTRLICEFDKHDSSADSTFLSEVLKSSCEDHDIRGAYKKYADQVFSILKQAEQKAHTKMHADHHHEPSSQHTVHLHEAQDIVVDIVGVAWALQYLEVQLGRVSCMAPVAVGGGEISFSHGRFSVPAPATVEIIEQYNIPTAPGPVNKELFTPTGAALLAALDPDFTNRDEYATITPQKVESGVGFGTTYIKTKDTTSVNAFYIFLKD